MLFSQEESIKPNLRLVHLLENHTLLICFSVQVVCFTRFKYQGQDKARKTTLGCMQNNICYTLVLKGKSHLVQHDLLPDKCLQAVINALSVLFFLFSFKIKA